MKIYSKFETDIDSETTGVWVDLGDGASVKVARFGNPKYIELVKKLRKPHQAGIQAGLDLPDDIRTAIAVESMAGAILLDWKGIEDNEGNSISYSFENAKKVLGELKDFRDTIAYIASQQETFRKMALEEIEKN